MLLISVSIKLREDQFSLQLNQDFIELKRNSDCIRVPLARRKNRRGLIDTIVIWGSSTLRLHLKDEDGVRKDEVTTSPIFPPNGLYEWARRQALIPRATYGSGQELLEVVLTQLDILGKKIICKSPDLN